MLFCLLLISATSCQKYINVNIKNTNPVLIIQAEIDPESEINQISISKSTFVLDANFAFVEDAKVTLTDEKNNIIYDLASIGKGIYQLNHKIQDVSANYRLDVNYQNITYSSTTRVARKIINPKAQIARVENFGDSSRAYQLRAAFKDTEPTQFNYYRLEIIIPTDSISKDKNYAFFDDSSLIKGTDSLKLQTLVFIRPRNFELNTFSYNLQSISKASFQFSQELDRILNPRGGDFGEKAANPTSTFNNGAIGNFSIRYKAVFK